MQLTATLAVTSILLPAAISAYSPSRPSTTKTALLSQRDEGTGWLPKVGPHDTGTETVTLRSSGHPNNRARKSSTFGTSTLFSTRGEAPGRLSHGPPHDMSAEPSILRALRIRPRREEPTGRLSKVPPDDMGTEPVTLRPPHPHPRRDTESNKGIDNEINDNAVSLDTTTNAKINTTQQLTRRNEVLTVDQCQSKQAANYTFMCCDSVDWSYGTIHGATCLPWGSSKIGPHGFGKCAARGAYTHGPHCCKSYGKNGRGPFGCNKVSTESRDNLEGKFVLGYHGRDDEDDGEYYGYEGDEYGDWTGSDVKDRE
jgi:hypothetical protein